MNCESAKTQLHGYLDGELDDRATADIEAHFSQCRECARELADLEQLRKTLRNLPRHVAPTALRARLEQTAASSATPPRPAPYRYWKFAASLLLAYLLGAGTLWYARSGNDSTNDNVLAQSLLESHLRALVASNPVDVVSSNRHVVKPWFSGRVALSPPVADFADEGFPLVGGRIDYIDHQRAAVLVYSHGQHVIDIYFLAAHTRSSTEPPRRINGYALTPLRIADQFAWMVTDMDEQESARFRQLLGRL